MSDVPERTPPNVEGDFYVEKDTCLACMAPEHEAPELIGYDEKDGCYFRRQPATPEELTHAVEAVWVSCVAALRYAGSDSNVLSSLHAKNCGEQCDVLKGKARSRG
ncbi:MAG: ferredoxin [Rubrivivax sp.]|nr:ferredoxin [Pyrinomonadaceae bacterium]